MLGPTIDFYSYTAALNQRTVKKADVNWVHNFFNNKNHPLCIKFTIEI